MPGRHYAKGLASLYIATGVLPSRQNLCNSLIRGLRPRLPSLRSVLPSRQLIPNPFCNAISLHHYPRIDAAGADAEAAGREKAGIMGVGADAAGADVFQRKAGGKKG